jgi:hypothetical protein
MYHTQQLTFQVFVSDDSNFCPSEAEWYLEGSPSDIAQNLMTDDDIPINCVNIKTQADKLSEGYAKWNIHMSNGMVYPRDERGLLKKDYDESFCFPSKISHIEVTGGKNNGWYGEFSIYDINGDDIPFICTDGCAAAKETTEAIKIVISGSMFIAHVHR